MALKMRVLITHAKPELCMGSTIALHTHPCTQPGVITLSISLIGVSKTRIITSNGSSEEINESSIEFLRIKKDIHKGPLMLEPGSVCWFNFRIPEDPASAQHDPLDVEMPWLRNKPSPQTLPPSSDFGSATSSPLD